MAGPTNAEEESQPTAADPEAAWGARRAPFSGNPQVGARGQRTRQRIVDAALEVFAVEGFHQGSIDRITTVAGCSRVAFYQYFSDKEDVYRHLAGQVGRQLAASAEALDPLTPDLAGWESLRAWIDRYVAIYQRYEPIFRAYQTVAAKDAELVGGSVRLAERDVASIRSRLASTTLPPRHLDETIRLLLGGVAETCQMASSLRVVAPTAHPPERVHDALTDIAHRSFFGVLPAVNVHPAPDERPPALRFSPNMRRALGAADGEPKLTAAGRRTLAALLTAGREVLVRRGFHATRVDDIVKEAGVSHGAFYRYFPNKEELARVVTIRSMRHIAGAFAEIPDIDPASASGSAALRRWLRRYDAAHAAETAMIRVWADAGLDGETVDVDAAAAFDWGRRRMARFLTHRDFGDAETDGIILMAIVAAFGTSTRSPATLDAAVHVVEQGVLGH